MHVRTRILRIHVLIQIAVLITIGFSMSGCGIGYLVSSAYNQADLLSQRVSVNDALNEDKLKLSEDERRKIRLADEARVFAFQELGLKKTKNYTQFVKLDRPYVTYVVNAAEKWRLQAYNWWYPIVGHMPYKGFFNLPAAQEEERFLQTKSLDTYVRGVSAFSTLGWLEDPLLSSMLKYSDHDLVNTIIHETMHATVFIKSEADFNERLAVFMGTVGAEEFYLKREGSQSKTVKLIQAEMRDEEIFGQFIAAESAALEKWYNSRSTERDATGTNARTTDRAFSEKDEELRQAKFSEIKQRFKVDIQPNLQTDMYKSFEEVKLNNARLMLYKLYIQDLSDFSKVFVLLKRNFRDMVKLCQSLEKSDQPEDLLKKIANGEVPLPIIK